MTDKLRFHTDDEFERLRKAYESALDREKQMIETLRVAEHDAEEAGKAVSEALAAYLRALRGECEGKPCPAPREGLKLNPSRCSEGANCPICGAK